jgi:hypothetical protein
LLGCWFRLYAVREFFNLKKGLILKSKEDLRKELAEQMATHLQIKPEAVKLYAAEREPDRRPWRKRPSLLDKAFAEVVADAEAQHDKKDARE